MTPDPHEPDRYGRSFADVYDDWYGDAFDTEATVRALHALAGSGPVLELGVGTGRLAVPLAATGLAVTGIDASTEMIDRCPTTDGLELVVGDMTHVDTFVDRPAGGFALVFCAFNTILNLTSLPAIAECLRSASRLLAADGRIVIEGFVPGDVRSLPVSSLTPARVMSSDPVFIESHFDHETSVLHGRHLQVRPDRVESRPWSVLVAGPQDLAALAPVTGLRIDHLWSDWAGTPLGVESTAYVMVLRTLGP